MRRSVKENGGVVGCPRDLKEEKQERGEEQLEEHKKKEGRME